MNAKYSIVFAALVLGACSTTGEVSVPADVEAVAVKQTASDSPGDSALSPTLLAANETPNDNTDDYVCRKERVIGSKFTKRVCRSSAQMETSENDAQELLRLVTLQPK